MKLLIIKPDGIVVDDPNVSEVNMPGSGGRLGVLDNHMPMVCSLKNGLMFYYKNQSREKISMDIIGGFAEIEDNELKILLDE